MMYEISKMGQPNTIKIEHLKALRVIASPGRHYRFQHERRAPNIADRLASNQSPSKGKSRNNSEGILSSFPMNHENTSPSTALPVKDARILVADEQPLILEGIRAVLGPHCGSIATVTDGRELVTQALLLKPDLIILDLKMPLLNGVDATIQIKKRLPSAKMLFFTMHKELTSLESAIGAGADGYVLKSSVGEELLTAIRNVLDGYSYVTPSLSNEQPFAGRIGMAHTLHLSPRERETLALIAEGKAAKEIAYILTISVKTVNFHRQNIRRKLGLNTTAELTRHAIEQGLV